MTEQSCDACYKKMGGTNYFRHTANGTVGENTFTVSIHIESETTDWPYICSRCFHLLVHDALDGRGV